MSVVSVGYEVVSLAEVHSGSVRNEYKSACDISQEFPLTVGRTWRYLLIASPPFTA